MPTDPSQDVRPNMRVKVSLIKPFLLGSQGLAVGITPAVIPRLCLGVVPVKVTLEA